MDNRNMSLIKKLYVVGFLFNREGTEVALIRKNRPAWQSGRLNGLGGKIEPLESAMVAMTREFEEEAGVTVKGWEKYAMLIGPDYLVDVFRAFDSEALSKVRTMTDEEVEVIQVDALQNTNTLSNLQWLIPLALNSNSIDLPIHVTYKS